MISIIRWFLKQSNIIKIYRMPPKTVLRANLLGLTLALSFVVFTIMSGIRFPEGFSFSFQVEECYRIFECFEFNIGIEISATGPQLILILLIFLLGTYLGGPFVIFLAFIYLFSLIINFEYRWLYTFLFLSKWYLIGYSFGAILGLLYNDIVFLYLIIFKRKYVKISFVYKKKNEFNVIKSPHKNEEYTPEGGWDERKLYTFNLSSVPENPYTILFIANPFFCEQYKQTDPNITADQFKVEIEKHRNNPDNFKPDPIMKNKDMFYKTVDRALLAFQSDEVLGNPDIWSRVRIITIFPNKLFKNQRQPNKFGLVESIQDRYKLDNRLIENLSIPLIHDTNVVDENDNNRIISPDFPDYNYKNVIQEYSQEFRILQEYENMKDFRAENINIDIIFALTAMKGHDRSTALFSSPSYNEDEEISELGNQNDESINNSYTFKTNFDPENIRQNENQRFHEFYNQFCGKVALNVIGLRQKTFIHEFAHAMSSNDNGAIVDEYFDQMQIGIEDKPDPAPFAINRLERNINGLVPIPERFAQYNNLVYLPDLDHPSAEEFWIGYFPQRTAPFIGCTMDRTIGHYQFDPLIKRFMYDRLIVKLLR